MQDKNKSQTGVGNVYSASGQVPNPSSQPTPPASFDVDVPPPPIMIPSNQTTTQAPSTAQTPTPSQPVKLPSQVVTQSPPVTPDIKTETPASTIQTGVLGHETDKANIPTGTGFNSTTEVPLKKEEVKTPPTATSTTNINPPPPKKGFPKIIIIAIAVIGILGIVLLLTRVISQMRKPKETTLTYWGLWEDESIMQPLIKEYEEKNPGVKISYIKQSQQDYRERLTSSLAKGSGPDIFRFHNSWVPMFRKELDNVPASVSSAADYATTYYPVVASDMGSGTGLVGIPLEYDALTLFINEEIFQQENAQVPTTWDDLRVLAKILTRTENGEITRAGVALGRTENVDHWPEILALMMIQNGVDLANPTDTRASDALTYFTLFSEVDGVWDEALPPSTVAFANGKLAMYFAPSWRAFNIKEINPALKFKTVALPQIPKDDPIEPDISYATYWVEGVWARSANKEAAWNFVKFLSETENLQKFYQTASSMRGFGEPYPKVEMADLLKDHPVVGSVIALAPDAESWYLADRTFDGPTGINSLINKYFEDAVNAVNDGGDATDALTTAAQGVSEVLSQYGLTK